MIWLRASNVWYSKIKPRHAKKHNSIHFSILYLYKFPTQSGRLKDASWKRPQDDLLKWIEGLHGGVENSFITAAAATCGAMTDKLLDTHKRPPQRQRNFFLGGGGALQAYMGRGVEWRTAVKQLQRLHVVPQETNNWTPHRDRCPLVTYYPSSWAVTSTVSFRFK